MNCPGSIALSAAVGESYESDAAREGTAAHAVAELLLHGNLVEAGGTVEGVLVTEDMLESVGVFVDYCRDLITVSNQCGIEEQFNLDALHPPVPMFGTTDFWSWHAASGTLEVVDLKFGRGVVVEVTQNKQLLYYALGAVLLTGVAPKRIKVTIVQPRAGHADGHIRSFEVDLLELAEFANELLVAARATQESNAPRVPGSWCRWCPAAGRCPEQHAAAMAVAQTDFATDVLPDPEGLPDAVLFAMLPKVHLLEDFLAAIQQRGESLMRSGVEIPGMKMVARRARRKWVDEGQTEGWIGDTYSNTDAYFDVSLKSVAQIEKMVGRKNLPPELVERVETGFKMVPAADPAPAVATIGASDDFLVLGAGITEDAET
jgi:hypothetical protein